MISSILNELDSTLVDLTETLDDLLDSLRCEREAIIEYDLKQITDVYKEKHRLLLLIQSLEKIKKQKIIELGKTLGFEGQPTLDFLLPRLKDQTSEEKIRRRLSCLKSLAQAAQEFNESQRELLAHSISHVQTSLALFDRLQGKSEYNKSGLMGNAAQNKARPSLMNRSV